jgi:ergothioneine biosynthesis protein EgtB
MNRAAARSAPHVSTLADLAAAYRRVREASTALAAPLSAEDCTVQSMPDASPVKWHLAHTTWFFETFVLERWSSGYEPFQPAFRVLFNSYYNAVGEKHPRPERGMLTRPSLDQVLQYRRHVDAAIEALLDRTASADAELADLVELGLNHEEQHQELILTDVKHLLSRNPLAPAYAAKDMRRALHGIASGWIAFAGGIRDIGATPGSFHFDNEGPVHQMLLRPFELASHPVTCGQYLEFMDDGGYRRPELWLSLGWDTVRTQAWTAPAYWRHAAGTWSEYTLHGLRPVDVHAPVCHLSYFEADAYARWADARLPTEFEWEAAAGAEPLEGNFVESGALHPRAPQAASTGAQQLFGDVWEWTQSSYAPYPGYRPAAGAVGEYNGKFMCNQYVLRGGSCVTPRRHIRATYRNFFPPDARWQFSGVRLARDAA